MANPSAPVRAGAQGALAILLLLTGCTPPPARDTAPASEHAAATAAAPLKPGGTPAVPVPSAGTTPSSSPSDKHLTLEGFAGLAIGKPVPAGSDFRQHPAGSSEGCLIMVSYRHPGVYALVEDGQVRRITAAPPSRATLAQGIGVGSPEASVHEAFPGFASTPAAYNEPPAHDLTQPGPEPRLRFEIARDRTVSAIHVGLEPQLGYIEGCS